MLKYNGLWGNRFFFVKEGELIMESSISKIASRFEKNLNNLSRYQNQSLRDNSDRTRTDRDRERDYERRRQMANSLTAEQVKEAVNSGNEDQLDAIEDMFYDARMDREASNKEILRAVDNNNKLLGKNYRLLIDMKSDMDSEEPVDIKSLSEANKEEILKAVLSNREVLDLILDQSEILTTLKQELIDNKSEEDTDEENKVFDKATAEKAFIDLEDHVHKENVKCYRNVQTAIAEQDALTYGKISKEVAKLKGIVITALLFGIADLAFMICWYLRLI